MCDLSEFLDANPRSRKLGAFSSEAMLRLAEYRMSSDISQFLQAEGVSSYHDNFYWTTLPQDHFQTLSHWGLPGEQCFTFLRTSLGGLFFWKKNKIYRLNPFTGYVVKSDFDFCEFMNLSMTMDSTLESNYFDIYQRGAANRLLNYDEIFALVPALPLGGSFESSKLEVVKMNEHLALLAQLFNNKTKMI